MAWSGAFNQDLSTCGCTALGSHVIIELGCFVEHVAHAGE